MAKSAQMRILSRPFTINQVQVSFQDNPPNVPKTDPNPLLSRPSSLKMCQKKGSFKTIEDGSKYMTLLSRPLVKKLVNMTKNQLLSRPLQIELKNLTLITWSPLMRQVKSFQILRPGRRHNQWQNSHPAVHYLPGSRFNPIYMEQRISVHQQYQVSSSVVPQQLWLHWKHEGWVQHQDRPNCPTSPAWKAESSHWVQGGDQEGASRDGPGKESSPNRLSPHHGSAAWHTPKRQMASWGYALTPRTWTRQSSMRITRCQPLRR